MKSRYFSDRNPNPAKFSLHIFVDQAGFLPSSGKRAVITKPCASFRLLDERGAVCFEGKTTHFGVDKNSEDDVYIADFSNFAKEGRYTLLTDFGERSLSFAIASNVYNPVFDSVCKAFYFLRCGCGLSTAHAGVYHHEKCHYKEAVLWENHEMKLDVSGGWHDAGDYGRYVTAGACAVAHILYAILLFPESFGAQRLNIPESVQPLPDMLSECKYELEWLLKMQSENGGVYHKATTAQHAAFVMPEQDNQQMYVLPISSIATADFAAVCALASRFFASPDPAFANRLLGAALKAGDWLERNPQFVGFTNPEGCGTGGYGELGDHDNRFWAFAELFSATGSEIYRDRVESILATDTFFPLTDLGYASIGGLGSLACIFCDKTDSILCDRLTEAFISCAEELAALSEECGYGAAMKTEQYGWGSNMTLLKHGMIFAIADILEGGNRFKVYAEAQLHYLLGCNATGYSYVTGIGEFCCNYPHLRPAHADGIEECMPGMVSGGANRNPCDEDALRLIAKGTPPMKCYADDVGCYSLNEITIYWNSPAVFLLAYLS